MQNRLRLPGNKCSPLMYYFRRHIYQSWRDENKHLFVVNNYMIHHTRTKTLKRVADSRDTVKRDALRKGRGTGGCAVSGWPGKRTGSWLFKPSYCGRTLGKIFRFVLSVCSDHEDCRFGGPLPLTKSHYRTFCKFP